MTPRQLEIIQHALGCDEYGRNDHPKVPQRGPYYRNHFCAGGKDEEVCKELVALGYMQQHKTTEMLPYFNCSVTPEGIKAMIEDSPKPPKLTRSKLRYREFLDAADAFNCTFREFLEMQKKQWYKDMKAGKSIPVPSIMEDWY